VPRPQPPTKSCPQAAPALQRHALPSGVVQPADDVDGRLRYATLVNGRIRILPTWLLTTSDRHVATRVATLLGGKLNINDDGLEQSYQVLTSYAELDVLLDGPQAILLRMLRRHGSTILRSCNSRTQQTPHGERPCQCPVALKARWEAAKTGRGCEPLIHLTCRLADDPTLGRFLFSSAAWTFAEHASAVRVAIGRCRRPVLTRLGIGHVLYATASGTTFGYTQPTIMVLPSAS
jgi:hypothetical protein